MSKRTQFSGRSTARTRRGNQHDLVRDRPKQAQDEGSILVPQSTEDQTRLRPAENLAPSGNESRHGFRIVRSVDHEVGPHPLEPRRPNKIPQTFLLGCFFDHNTGRAQSFAG